MELIDNRDEKGKFTKGNNIAQYTQLKYNNPEEAQKEIDKYYLTLNNENKPTLAGLALFLGFADRQSIHDYMNSPTNPCSLVIKKAVLAIEAKHEQHLYDNGCAGSIFWLKQRGYSDNPEVNTLSDNALSELFDKIKPTAGKLPQEGEK